MFLIVTDQGRWQEFKIGFAKKNRKERRDRYFVEHRRRKRHPKEGICPRRNMDKMIRELYNNMLKETGDMEKISKETKEEIMVLLSGEKEGLKQEEYGKYKDFAFYVGCAAEENGFVKGFRYAFWLFAECMQQE